MKSQDRNFLRSSEGKGMVGCLIFIVLLAVAVYVAIQVGPVYYSNYAMESELKKEISRAGAHSLDDEQIVQDVMNIARRNDVPLQEENITVQHVAGQVGVEINYAVPVNLIVLERDLNFKIKVSSFVGSL